MGSLFLSAVPSAYAWQVYGWKIGLGTFVVVAALMSATEWTFLLRGWPLQWLARARVGLIIVAMIAIGISSAELCNFEMTICRRILWPN